MNQVRFELNDFCDRGRAALRIEGDVDNLLGKKNQWRIKATVTPLSGLTEGEGGKKIADNYIFTPINTMTLRQIPGYVWQRVYQEWGGRPVSVQIEAVVIEQQQAA